MEVKFYRCRHCGNVVQKLVDSGVPVVCCGEPMEELTANTVDASQEKHVPHVTRIDEDTIKVQIGSQPHPMTPDHHIEFIYVVSGRRITFVDLRGKEVAEAIVSVSDPKTCINNCRSQRHRPITVYEYCNLHGLWKTTFE